MQNPLLSVQHLDRYWCIEDGYASAVLEHLAGVDLADAQRLQQEYAARVAGRSRGEDAEERPYALLGKVAVLSIEGPLTKKPTCMGWLFGGTSTVQAQRALRQAVRDPEVESICLSIDSPGGQVAGTADLANAVAQAAQRKPVTAYVSDMAASAAYWIACQAQTVVANETALIGSIGTYMVLIDASLMYRMNGMEVVVIGEGEYKGAGVRGTPITEAQKADFRRTVQELNAQFLAGVGRGRKMTAEQVSTLADGRVHVGQSAVALGLADEIASWDAVIARLQGQTRPTPATALW